MNKLLAHWLKAIFSWLLAIAAIPLLLAGFLLLTPTGLKTGLFIANQFLPGELRYKNVNGALIGPLSIGQFSYRYEDKQIDIKGLTLQWLPSTLLAGKLSIQKLVVEDVVLTLPSAPAPADSVVDEKSWRQQIQEIRPHLTNVRLPLNLDVKKAVIKHIVLNEKPGVPSLEAASVSFSGKIEPDILQVHTQAQLISPYSIHTELTLDGSPENYSVQFTALNPQIHWTLNGRVSPEQIQLDTKDALIFSGSLNMHLVWNWKAPIFWQLNIEGRNLDFSRIQPDWPRRFDITLDSSGNLDEIHPSIAWNAIFKTQTQQAKILTQGKYDAQQQWNIQWDVDVRQLAELIPFSSGAVKSTGELHGALNHPITKGHLEAQRLRWQDYRFDKTAADWNIDATQKQNSVFQMTGEQLFTPWFELQKLALNAQGKWEKHQLSAKMHGYNTDLQLSLDGGLNANQWKGSLKTLSLSTPYAGTWTLTQPTTLFLSPERVDVTALCIQQSANKSQACLRGQWQASTNAWQTALTGQLNFQQLGTLLPEDVKINLPLSLHISAQGVGKEIQQAQLTGDSGAGSITYSTPEQSVHTIIKSTEIRAKLDKSGGLFNFRLLLADNNSLSASITMPHATHSTKILDPNQALEGKLDVEFNNLKLLQTILPDVLSSNGKFLAHFAVGGTLNQPLINGSARLEQSDIKIPGLNIQLNKINMALNAKGSDLFYNVSAESDGRPLHLTGKTQWNEAGFPSDLRLTGDKVLLANTPSYTVYVSPDVRVVLKGRDIDISGTVNIPEATLHKLEFQSETTLPENEMVYVGEHPIEKKAPWNTSLQLTINLGDKVTADSPGLKGKFSGSLIITSQPGQVALGTGRINISNGIYSVYGRELNITPGSGIIYRRNPLSNPSLSIQAVTRVIVTDAVSQQQLGTNEITVGMNVGGTSSSPQVTLFSSAGNLSQADMLSYLLLGTSSGGISPTNMNLLLQALNTLPLTKKGAGNVEGMTNQIKQSLGLSEFGVESETVFGPAGQPIPTSTPTSYFVVGKRLTSRIYFRYKYDPFNSVNLFQLNYYFSKNWSLQLETDGNTQSGADILYTIETGTPKSADRTPAPPPKNN